MDCSNSANSSAESCGTAFSILADRDHVGRLKHHAAPRNGIAPARALPSATSQRGKKRDSLRAAIRDKLKAFPNPDMG
jgi:hypothetical protein